jgi:G3E family GTPase
VFSEPGQLAAPGATIRPGPKCSTLRLEEEAPHRFILRIDEPGLYALFTEHTPEEFELKLLDAHGRAQRTVASKEFNPGHEHDDTVSSVSLEFDRSFDSDLLNDWLGSLLQARGPDIFRMKGILSVESEDSRVVFQGVHMLMDTSFGPPWGDEPRRSRIVFIGRNLEAGALRSGLASCLA